MNVQKLIREGSPLCFRFQYTSSRMTLITVSPEEQSERQRCAAVPSNIFFFNFAWFTVRRTSDGLIALLWAWGDWWALMTLFGLCMLQIRKRRPTPASLVIMNEHVPPGKCQHTFQTIEFVYSGLPAEWLANELHDFRNPALISKH